MELNCRKFLWLSLTSFLCAHPVYAQHNKAEMAIENGLRYMESVQLSYGEFPTTFTPNIKEPARSLQTTFDSNLFATAMLADALDSIEHPRAIRMKKKAAAFISSQLDSEHGLWSYFTTHNPKPLYPKSIFDLDDTVFASMVLQQNNIAYPDNVSAINANKTDDGLYATFVGIPKEHNDIDCGVNANVLSYLKENNHQVCNYLVEQVKSGKQCALYYNKLDAYYLIARAYERGISCLKPVVQDIISYGVKQFNKVDGSVDHSPFKTAMALNTLHSLGYQGLEVARGKAYLLQTQSKVTGSWPADYFWFWSSLDEDGNAYSIGRSSSRALTTAFAVKALSAV